MDLDKDRITVDDMTAHTKRMGWAGDSSAYSSSHFPQRDFQLIRLELLLPPIKLSY
jgi:hypothetical protein